LGALELVNAAQRFQLGIGRPSPMLGLRSAAIASTSAYSCFPMGPVQMPLRPRFGFRIAARNLDNSARPREAFQEMKIFTADYCLTVDLTSTRFARGALSCAQL
jgi:hypothetical protein